MSMSEYEIEVWIDELQKLIVSKEMTIKFQNVEIRNLRETIKRQEEKLSAM